MQTGKKVGMQLLDDAIQTLLERGWITPLDAYANSLGASPR